MADRKKEAQEKLWQAVEELSIRRPVFNDKRQVSHYENVPAQEMMADVHRLLIEDQNFLERVVCSISVGLSIEHMPKFDNKVREFFARNSPPSSNPPHWADSFGTPA